MLPFLKKKVSDSGIATIYRTPDPEKSDKSEEDHGLDACAEDILRAISSNDKKLLARSLTAAFDILESQPHEEYGDNETAEE